MKTDEPERKEGNEKIKKKEKKRKLEIQRRIRGDKKKAREESERTRKGERTQKRWWKRRPITVLVSPTTGAGRTPYKTPSRRCIECNFHLRADPSLPVFSMPIPIFVVSHVCTRKGSNCNEWQRWREDREFENWENRRSKIEKDLKVYESGR